MNHMMKAKHQARRLVFATGALFSFSVAAEWSVTMTAVSDYLFNGVSQTGHKPALQLGLDWSSASGWYAGLWSSNVDFDDDTRLEADAFIGYAREYRPGWSLDAGISYYTYHGARHSSDYNYPEAYLKLGIAGFGLNAWYAPDYFGLDVGHVIVMLKKEFKINDTWSISASADRSMSLDADRFSWDAGRSAYNHWQIMAHTSFVGFDCSLGVSGTTLGYPNGDTTVLFTVGRTFKF